ncbi:Inner membrane protein YejM [Vibrio stylophorae]|uniref:Inner membrane protein YejM n=1 Tax=Vibrio stylophorae TaxID=659351 RepID=A0ABN8DWJ0_9VIBR|nr:DUF3413 domain-containing protein [Vibrio stylophorae]CAH0534679.1 Inner membrane protein YejM [Vibrio stylophorae]
MTTTLRQRLHQHGWFILVNSILAMLISVRYFGYLPATPDAATLAYIVAAVIGQMSLICGLVGLLTLPVVLLPRLSWRLPIMAVVGSVALATLVIDTFVFAQYRFHINAMVLEMILAGQIVSFPLITWITVIGGVVLLLAGQAWLYCYLGREPKVMQKRIGRKSVLVIFLALLATNAVHIWAAANAYQPITNVTRYLPLFYPATASSFMKKHGWMDEEALAKQRAMTVSTKSDFAYPLNPVQFKAVTPPNIVFIVVDSWRYDTLNEVDAPNMAAFAKQGMVFDRHTSTGNATRTGIFGLFYGVPGTYWHAALSNQTAPVLMDRLQALDYQIGVFAAAQLEKPEFNRTVFANLPNLKTRRDCKGNVACDREITADWLNWFKHRNVNQPSFSFLFYDSPHGYAFPSDYAHRFEPMVDSVNYLELDNDFDATLMKNRYRTSVHFTDSLIAEVIDALKASGELDHTLVVITGDHSQEMNDNGLNFWGHNGNFTDAQVHVPFVLVGAGITPEAGQANPWNAADARTSHEDVSATLLHHYLGATSPMRDYTNGLDLLDPAQVKARPWIMSSNYSGYAVISEDGIVEVNNAGGYQNLDSTNHPNDTQLNYDYLKQAMEVISRYNH